MDNPVINSNGDKSWWLNGQLHRTDGPAIEYANGQVGWYLYHIFLKMDKRTANVR